MLRDRNLQILFHIFDFLKFNLNGVMVSDLTEPDIDESKSIKED